MHSRKSRLSHPSALYAVTVGMVMLLHSQPAVAQAVSENAVTDSDDAFGRSVGNESTGLYSSREIRGFNPVDAGNVRLDSLYFDQVNSLSYRLTNGTTIRVGFSTQGYSFPAPTGLVDYALAEVGRETVLEFDVNGYAEAWAPRLAAELRVPLNEKLGFYLGGARLDFHQPDGRDTRNDMFGGVVTWKPYSGARVSAFGWRSSAKDEEARPTLFTDGTTLPPKIERGVDLSQSWADNARKTRLHGLIAHLPVAGMQLEMGAFSDQLVEEFRFADLLTGVDAAGTVADRAVVASEGGRDRSRSGEIRLVKRLATGDIQHRITLSLRGRARDRLFGGSERVSLGPSTLLAPDRFPRPAFAFGEKNRDRVRQVFYGAAYSGYFFRRLLVDVGISRTEYRKRIEFADDALPDVETRASPLLWNASAAFDLTSRLSVFAGAARGMEEALVAPDRATNRSEAPPAIRTRQKEAGLRYAAGDSITAVVSAFRIVKPYYNLDPSLRYRLLGTVTNTGIEVSTVVRPTPGVTLLGGAVLANPKISGEAVESGLVGLRPIGQPRTRLVGNLDWRFAGGRSPLSIDASFERSSGKLANASNSLSLPAKTVFDLGLRYRLALGSTAVLFRAKVENVFNDYSWDVAPTGGLTYSDPRRLQLQVITDF